MADPREFPSFHKVIQEEESVEGLEDFLRRVPRVALQRLTDCGRRPFSGLYLDENFTPSPGSEVLREGEIKSRMGYRGFTFYWGMNSSRITTRLLNPAEIKSSLMAVERAGLPALLDIAFGSDSMDFSPKFYKGEMVESTGSDVIVAASVKGRAGGKFRFFWESYWYGVMKPLVALVQGYMAREQAMRRREST